MAYHGPMIAGGTFDPENIPEFSVSIHASIARKTPEVGRPQMATAHFGGSGDDVDTLIEDAFAGLSNFLGEQSDNIYIVWETHDAPTEAAEEE